MLDRLHAEAGSTLIPVVVTFDPHPRSVVRPEAAPLLLTTLEQRLDLLATAGVQGVLILAFTSALAAESPDSFARRVLAETLRARKVVVGRNFRFGHRAAGDVGRLAELGDSLGFAVTAVDLAEFDDLPPGDPAAVSSTAIRSRLAAGDVAGAAAALGRWHRLSGSVVAGDRRGRELGYPTANVDVDPAIAVPADGVYAARLRTQRQPDVWLDAAVSVGSNPTFQVRGRRVEAFVLDAPDDFDIYGARVDVEFLARIRSMQRFDTPADLVAQMQVDVARTREVLADMG